MVMNLTQYLCRGARKARNNSLLKIQLNVHYTFTKDKKIMTTVQTTLDGEKVYPHQVKCAWCGKTFIRHYKTVKYCSDECRAHALREQKAIYQRKRRKSINDGVLCSNESQYIGTGFLSQNRRESFDDEYMAVRKELKRLKIKHYY